MKTSTVLWIVVLVLIVAGLVWWLSSGSTPTTPNTATTASSTIPGANLTLGEGSNTTFGQYLVGYNGMTLYKNANDTTGTSTCTGDCATTWPPYTVSDASSLVAESPISGTLSTITRGDGSMQVTYNGMPLYFYSGDAAPGDVNGTNAGTPWSLAKP